MPPAKGQEMPITRSHEMTGAAAATTGPVPATTPVIRPRRGLRRALLCLAVAILLLGAAAAAAFCYLAIGRL